ncbi:MAG: histidine kinase [Prolixibacteraceae bacterium]|nr:histidine kinase [Prolixibacteraceae bacterium]
MQLTLRNTIFSNWIIALVLLVPLVIWVKPLKQKYKITVNDVEFTPEDQLLFYADLDNDGNSQRIGFSSNIIGNNCLKLFIEGARAQINMYNQPTPPWTYGIGDYNNSGINDFFCLGHRNDSIFINHFEYIQPYDPSEYFVVKLPHGADYEAYVQQVTDLDGDGQKEVVFTINAGFVLQPRKIYAYSIARDTLFQSPLTGVKPDKNVGFIDFEDNEKPVLITGTSNSRNYGSREVPYSDMYCWLMGYNHNLGFLFPPVKITEQKAKVQSYPFIHNKKKRILTTCVFQTENNNVIQYAVYDFSGRKIRSDSLVFYDFKSLFYQPSVLYKKGYDKNEIAFFNHHGTMYKLTDDYKFVKKRKIKDFSYPGLIAEADLDGNGQKELVFQHGYSNTISVTDRQLKNISRFELQSDQPFSGNISLYKQVGKPPLLVIQKGNELFHVAYRHNPLWLWRFPLYVLMYAAIFGFLLLLQFIQKENIKRKLFAKQQIKELQYKVISSQLNPHFTFNAINSLAHIAYDPNKPELYDKFINFSRLVRTMLADTDKNARSLKSELRLTTDFLEIQTYRFSNAFSYSIKIDDDVDQNILVPKLIIQLFAENAIKHAFPCKTGKDHLQIEIKNLPQSTKIEISDNGIGRKEAAKRLKKSPDKSNGIGMKVMQDFIDLLNEQNKQKISFNIFDRSENNLPTGTIVQIHIPKQYKYK